MKDIVGTTLASSPWAVILAALWKAPDWMLKWLDVRDRWRRDR